MKNSRKFWIEVCLAGGSVILDVCLMLFRGWDLRISGIVAMALFAIYTYCCLTYIRGLKPAWIVVSILAGLVLLHIPVRLANWEESLVTFPDMIMHFVGVAFGWVFSASKKSIRLWLLVPLFVLAAVGYILIFYPPCVI